MSLMYNIFFKFKYFDFGIMFNQSDRLSILLDSDGDTKYCCSYIVLKKTTYPPPLYLLVPTKNSEG